jgi:hypothetical protein
MNKNFKTPPSSPTQLTHPTELAKHLFKLVGQPFQRSGKTRTDGSNIRKLVAATLEQYELPEVAKVSDYEIVPLKGKGIPKITREFVDTYIVTLGRSYNLQVWNRIPNSNALLIKYESGESLKCTDVRFVFVRIDTQRSLIASVIVLTPDYIEKHFGKFGKPTVKHQLMISSKVRQSIYNSDDKILSFPDSKKLSYFITDDYSSPTDNMVEEPSMSQLYSIALIKKLVAKKLIGQRIKAAATKNRGQLLERKVLELLGYSTDQTDLLYGGFPDIKNQLLEVKIQDSFMVDLGQFSPEKKEIVIQEHQITTHDIRYLIALTNPKTEIIEGIILSPGERLGDLFSYVSDQSYKCQRSIPMSFFDRYAGQSVFNPD